MMKSLFTIIIIINTCFAINNNTTQFCSRCPAVFGLGHQKSGTTTILVALGSASKLTVQNDVPGFWNQKNLTDDEVCKSLHSNTQIQKEGHAWKYLTILKRICPNMTFYVIERKPLHIIRSVADRLNIIPEEGCESALNTMPKAWKPLFRFSNDTSCLVRLASSVSHMTQFLESEVPKAVRIRYEDYVASPATAISKLCDSLEFACNTTHLDLSQQQRRGKNHGKNISLLWPHTFIDRINIVLNI